MDAKLRWLKKYASQVELKINVGKTKFIWFQIDGFRSLKKEARSLKKEAGFVIWVVK